MNLISKPAGTIQETICSMPMIEHVCLWKSPSGPYSLRKTVQENGLEGGEELVFANLMWLDVV